MNDRRPGVADRYERVMEPATTDALRHFFKNLNRGMVLLWRLGLGWFGGIWPRGFGRILVIEHTGRKSGNHYRTPVNYTIDGGDLYCLAGFGPQTDWYRNLMAQPNVAVWLPRGRWEAEATEQSEHPRRLELIRQVLRDSGFASHAVGLHPDKIDEDSLATATATYRLVRIRPTRPQPSVSGPGDLKWTWVPLAVLFGAAWLYRRRR